MMVSRWRLRGLVLTFVGAVLLTGSVLPSSAQDSPAGAKPPTAGLPRLGVDQSRRVPPFFGQIGLTPEQREKVYEIRAKHQKRLDEAQKQVLQIQSEMMTECETVLNDTQKKLLAFRRDSSAKAKKRDRSTTPETPATTKGDEKASN